MSDKSAAAMDKANTGTAAKSPRIKLFFKQVKTAALGERNENDMKLKRKHTVSDTDEDRALLLPSVTTLSTGEMIEESGSPLVSLRSLVSRFCAKKEIAHYLLDHLSNLLSQTPLIDREAFEGCFARHLIRVIEFEVRRLTVKAREELDFSNWLSNDSFLDAVYASVLIAGQPALENGTSCNEVALGLSKPFDIIMVLESLLKAGVDDPRMIKRLTDIEQSLLEEGVWADSQVFHLLKSDHQQRKADPMVAKVPQSPRKAIASMTAAAESECAPRMTRLELFFRKYFRLTLAKIDRLCGHLGLAEPMPAALWQAFVSLVEGEHRIALLGHRHLDQLLACLIYSVCKFYDYGRTFKQIIGALQPVPEARYKAVWMGSEGSSGDLVAFYNQIFLPLMHGVIHSLPPMNKLREAEGLDRESEDQHPTNPVTPKTPKQPPIRRRRVSFAEHQDEVIILPMPAVHSPIGTTANLSGGRIQLCISPMKHHLTRSITPTRTPTKLSLSVAGSASANKAQEAPSRLRDTRVNRRLEF